MALVPTTTLNPGNLVPAGTGWLIDSTNYDFVPAVGSAPVPSTSNVNDAVRSFGRQAGSAVPIARTLLNQMVPASVYMMQTVPGAETNTFTARAPIQGTLINLGSIGDGIQVAGTFPAGALNVVGRVIRCSGGGTMGTNASTPNFTFDVALGANILATTGSLATVAAVATPANFWFTTISTVITVGSSGTIQTVGCFNYFSGTNVTYTIPMANSTPGTALSLDLTATQAVSFNATCGTSHANNRVRLFNFMVEIVA